MEPEEKKRLQQDYPAAAGSGNPTNQAADDLVGTIYVGRYQLESIIGSGGMGVIFRGRQIFLDRVVAVKMLKSNLASAKAQTRFHQEARAASALNHPGIVSIVDFGVDELDRPYMVMEYVEGCTLSDLLLERLTLPVEDLLPVVLEICDALSAAHKKGIVHRDLKPANIMLVVCEDGEVHIKLLDFGIAKMLDMQEHTMQDLTKTGDKLGTPLYMSPEQVESRTITYRSDLYSLGCTLYACLTGAPPFIGESKIATMEMHCTEKPPSLKEGSAGLDFPLGIEQIVMRLLEKRPEDRYESADQLKDAMIAMAVRNGFMSRPHDQQNFGGQPYLDGGITKISKSISDTVHRSGNTNSSASPQRAERDRRQRLHANETSADTGSRQKDTLFWKADLPDRIKAARGGKVKGAPRRADPNSPQEADLPNRLESSLNRIFAVVGAVVVALVLAVVGVAAFYLGWIPHNTQTTIHGDPDKVIHQKLVEGATDFSFSFRDQKGLTENGLRELASFKFLRALDLCHANITGEGLRYLVNSRLNLINLDQNPDVSDPSLYYLGQMRFLQSLSLAGTSITDSGLGNLAVSSSIHNLVLGDNRGITNVGIKKLEPAKSPLVSLYLQGCNITDDAAEDLLKFKSLVRLDLAYNPGISDSTLQVLQRKSKGLELLILSKDNIGDDGIHALKGFKELKILDLSYIELSPNAITDLATMKGLTNLYLRGCNLSSDQMQRLSAALGPVADPDIDLKPRF